MDRWLNKILLGDCLDVMREMPDKCVDSIVTDPPYGLKFMGKKWDYDVPSVALWEEAYRVLKPGAHVLSFGGTRTYHRMVVNIEDAGFEIRDQILWIYGCLDEATQVATSDGVKHYHETRVGDTVLCYNIDTGEYSYQPILEVVEYDYADTAYRFIGDFGEQVVSRNHRVIVERDGAEVFELAENLAREQQAHIPILESLPELRQAVYDAQSSTSGQEQDLLQGVCKCADRQGKLRRDADEPAQRQNDQLCGMRQEGVEAGRMAAQSEDANVQQGVQWTTEGAGMEGSRPQGQGELVAGVRAGAKGSHDGAEQSGMEGWADVPKPQGRLCQPADQVCEVPRTILGHGTQGRLCDGASDQGCASNGKGAESVGGGSPHQSRFDGQPARKPDAVSHEWGTQGVRAWRGHKTAVVRIEPFRYVGKVWCLRVPTGAFVAVRNGAAFPTGNSGFPKSLNIGKAVDSLQGNERIVIDCRDVGHDITHNSYKDAKPERKIMDITKGNTAWEGWGTALKPACEPLILATKPLTVVPLDDMLQAETTLGGLICLSLSSVKYVESLLALSPKEYEGASVSAHLIAGALHGIRSGELSGRTDMFKSPEMVKIILSIVELWKTTLDVNYSRQNTFTIETALSLTTALRTFTLLISGIIQESITLEGAKELGRLLNVSIAAKNLKEQIATSKKETSVQELVSFLTMQNTANIAVKNFMPVVRIANSALLNATINLEEEFKPNLEPICLARKPLEGTVANNVLKWGTGGMNIDGCRVGTEEKISNHSRSEKSAISKGKYGNSTAQDTHQTEGQALGRFPANVIHDGSDEVLQHFPESNGQQGAVTGNEPSSSINNCYGQFNGRPATTPRNDTGSAARFFKQCNFTEDENEQRIKYCAKASTSERGDGNNHPTVKPLDLIKYLVKLITPPDGIVLDMFGGSGTTALACLDLGFPYIVIEKEPDYVFIANERIKQATRQARLFP